jgi:hypothetical protein
MIDLAWELKGMSRSMILSKYGIPWYFDYPIGRFPALVKDTRDLVVGSFR